MKILSINVNGLNSFVEKGAFNQILDLDPDIICIQETKASEIRVGAILEDLNYNYIAYSNSNHWKKGYAGVSTLIKQELKPRVHAVGFPDLLPEYGLGRIVTVMLDSFLIVNVYTLNSGNKDDLRKEWDRNFKSFIGSLQLMTNPLIIGDLNVVPDELDYWGNYETAINSSPGLMDFEVEGLKNLKSLGLVDSFRELYPEQRSYSWYHPSDKEQEHGWRIDLALMSRELLTKVSDFKIHENLLGSDHRPIELTLNI